MARITQQQKIENQKKYNQVVLDLFLAEGHESLTYARIAKEIGVSLTTLQGYFPSTRAIRAALHGHILPIIMKPLDFTNENTFYESWDKALDEPQFQSVMKLIFFHASQAEQPQGFDLQADGVFREKAIESFGSNARQVIETVIGRSLLRMTNFRPS
ncbi:TetR/AcrR family transcriptional regulator [Vibrio fortis]|uniref:TetR/AcrR family transcriptional regulator n=1 Tax=Vibrio fortis TaxID=212667 RepID=A0A5N3R167_9VIBR|nr:TetR family transcriptional regulator [Vibrio fortis]KAB0288136.1 TetR/AcrR family transcriptional regulator [Vibrio fortis]